MILRVHQVLCKPTHSLTAFGFDAYDSYRPGKGNLTEVELQHRKDFKRCCHRLDFIT